MASHCGGSPSHELRTGVLALGCPSEHGSALPARGSQGVLKVLGTETESFPWASARGTDLRKDDPAIGGIGPGEEGGEVLQCPTDPVGNGEYVHEQVEEGGPSANS